MKRFRPTPSKTLLMAALLHDASEYVTHDLVTPLKTVVGDVFREVEDRLMCAVHMRFGLPTRLAKKDKDLIKKADLIAAATEATQLAGFTVKEARTLLSIGEKPADWVTLEPMPGQGGGRPIFTGFSSLQEENANH